MKSNLTKWFAASALCASLGAARTVSAASSAQISQSKVDVPEATAATKPVYIYGGLGLGYSALYSKAISGNADGTNLAVSLLLSHKSRTMVYDGGVGWMYNRISGNIIPGGKSEVSTRAGFAELSPRIRFGERWQLGAVGHLAYGTDVKFGPDVKDKNFLTMVGPIAVYELPLKGVSLRPTLKYLTDLNIQDRQMHMLMAGIQIGFAPETKEKAQTVESKVETIQVAQAAPVRSTVRVDLNKEFIHFGTGSSKLNRQAREYLSELAKVLSARKDAFASLQVNGHTDERGSFEYNQKLSEKRASSVRNEIAKNDGITEKVIASGYSESQPLIAESNPKAWAKNRRVELVFNDVKDEDGIALKQALEELNARYKDAR